MTRLELADIIEDYTVARMSGRSRIVAPFADALKRAIEELLPEAKPEVTDPITPSVN